MADVMIPPWVRPESPETIRIIDDATVAFQPAFGRGTTQRGIFADPRWGMLRRYRGLRSDEKAAILIALNETRGQFNVLRVTPHSPLRGSFPAVELLSNNSFANGTTGWTATNCSLIVSDRIGRLVSTAGANSQATLSQNVALTQYVPYVLRVFVIDGLNSAGLSIGPAISSGSANDYSSSRGMRAAIYVPPSGASSGQFPIVFNSGAYMAGDFVSVPYTSLARCALVDNRPNYLVRSDEFNLTWVNVRTSDSADVDASPDASVTSDRIIEDSTASNTHYIEQAATVPSAVADWEFSCALKAGTRTWAQLVITEGTGGGTVSSYFNIGAGSLGTAGAGTNWSDSRAFIAPLGGGWFHCVIIGRKTNAATTLTASVRLATADNGAIYSGNGSGYISAWRADLGASSVPSALRGTSSAGIPSGFVQSGSAINTKGWPISTDGLMLTGDWFELNGELKQLTAPVNSNALGLAYMQFRPGLAGSPADNDAIIIQEPFGRFIYPAGTRELQNMFGLYADCEMNLEEVYA